MLLSALIDDALDTDREPTVTALVAAENIRSRRLLARMGFSEDPLAERHHSTILGRAAPYLWQELRYCR